MSSFDIVAVDRSRQRGAVGCHFGDVQVRTQVTSFLRRLPTGEVIGEHPLDLPIRSLPTKAVWWTLPADLLLGAAGVPEAAIPGAAHAAEHAAIGMLPLVATSDRWDIGGVSTALTPTPACRRSSSTTATRAGPASPSAGYEALDVWLRERATPSPAVPASGAARPASSRRSVATATSRWTRPGPSRCST